MNDSSRLLYRIRVCMASHRSDVHESRSLAVAAAAVPYQEKKRYRAPTQKKQRCTQMNFLVPKRGLISSLVILHEIGKCHFVPQLQLPLR